SVLDPKARIKRSTIKKDYIISKLKRENIGEEIRVLYVAMTRAKEKLIMVGSVKDVDKWFQTGSVGEYSSYLSIVSEGVTGNMNKYFLRVDPDFSKGEEKLIKKEADLSVLRANFISESDHADGELLKNLRERFSFKYPYESLSKLYTKTTVSKLKTEPENHEDDEAVQEFTLEEEEYVPIFAGGKEEVKGNVRGTAYHKMLKLLEFKDFKGKGALKEENKAELARQLKVLNDRNKMPKEEQDLVFMGKIVSFFESDLANEMIEADKAGKLFKEQPFVIGVDASEIDPEFPKGETILVQGVIDAYYITGDKIVILDYKTDKVDSKEELILRYQKQLKYYAKALEQITGLKALRLYIYSFGLGTAFVID
ncbi:MAG: PD-(D/E)XK nuclease family protein, partial [Lachnospiraceae bacterium]|nr:PD-(D/E)XK nuclease family protein [Lachnospiraceae bacterium]